MRWPITARRETRSRRCASGLAIALASAAGCGRSMRARRTCWLPWRASSRSARSPDGAHDGYREATMQARDHEQRIAGHATGTGDPVAVTFEFFPPNDEEMERTLW